MSDWIGNGIQADGESAVLLVAGQNTWVTLDEANVYMGARLGASRFWVGTEKEPALATAYNWLMGCGKYTFPASVDKFTERMKQAQCEMALFLLQHGFDMDIRMGLQAQGVRIAGMVKETYRGDRGNVEVPIPPIVDGMLKDYRTRQGFAIVEIERDENEAADHDAFGSQYENLSGEKI